MPKVRFVDVERRCVQSFDDRTLLEFRYIALSYVWGSSPLGSSHLASRLNLQFEASTSRLLQTPGSFDSLDLPQTVADVLDLARALNIPYVWIDRLCICQDSIADKSVQISKMHAIYNAACLTVIAAAGVDVNAGLPGLREGTRHQKQHEIVVVPSCSPDCPISHDHNQAGLSLMTTLSPWIRFSAYLDATVWSHRGKTSRYTIFTCVRLMRSNE